MRSGILIAFIIALLKGVYGGGTTLCSNRRQCLKILPQELVEESWQTIRPDAEFLKKYCPSVKAYLSCKLISLKLCSNRVNEYSEISKMNNVTVEICDEESGLHKAFVKNIDCLYPLLSDRQFTDCFGEAREEGRRYVLHRSYQEEDESVDDQEFHMESQCLILHLNDQCMSSIADEKCGREAGETFQEINHRMDDFCTEEEMSDINAKYQEMLNDEPTMARLSEMLLNQVSEQEKYN